MIVTPKLTQEFEVKGIKTFEGREGYGLNATLYRNGKPFAFFHDAATGGQPDLTPFDQEKPSQRKHLYGNAAQDVLLELRDYILETYPECFQGDPEENWEHGTGHFHPYNIVDALAEFKETCARAKKNPRVEAIYSFMDGEEQEYFASGLYVEGGAKPPKNRPHLKFVGGWKL